jgi:hypothetical protein
MGPRTARSPGGLMTDKERLLAAGRIEKIGRGRVSKADREWLDAHPAASGEARKPGSQPKVIADLPPSRWPEGTKAVALDGSGVAGPNECCGPCGVHYRWCQCDLRLPPVPPRVIVGSVFTDVRLEAPGI